MGYIWSERGSLMKLSDQIEPISERMQETVALLKILALGNRQIEAGQVEPAASVIARFRERRRPC